jgi:hypothetical protein
MDFEILLIKNIKPIEANEDRNNTAGIRGMPSDRANPT